MKSFIYKFIFSLSILCLTSVYGASIQTVNKILVNVGEKPITVLDIKKEMDRQIYMRDKRMFNDTQAVYKHYAQNWKYTLKKMTEDEILLLEAKKLEYKIPETDITQKVTELFGDNNVVACKDLSFTPEEARRISNREIISGYLSWFGFWGDSINKATPKAVMEAYTKYTAELEKKDKWTYQAVSVKGKEEKIVQEEAAKIKNLLQEGECTNLSLLVQNMQSPESDVNLRASKDITLEKSQLSNTLLTVLGSLDEGMASDIITTKKGDEYTGKIFQLKSIQKQHIPAFVDVSADIKNAIVNESGIALSVKYFASLYKKYDIHGLYGDELNSSKLEPFSLQND
ncbi:MAG: hypothetical protein SP4CHLAM5_05630 [Chlamydiia bacterium]|nr:hypothetical protein [Chlamydiia bacterium]MCH9618433.1 hypothetical protein [Chlamydiia bacterium]MCH9623759.1 hypothetical protein [Chlamydiia bacterium]